MRQEFLAEVRQFLIDIPEGEVKVDIDLYPSEPDLLRQLEKDAAELGWALGTNMGHRWYSSNEDVISDDAIDSGDVTVYL